MNTPDQLFGICVGGPLDGKLIHYPQPMMTHIEIKDGLGKSQKSKIHKHEFHYGVWVHESETFESAIMHMAAAYYVFTATGALRGHIPLPFPPGRTKQ